MAPAQGLSGLRLQKGGPQGVTLSCGPQAPHRVRPGRPSPAHSWLCSCQLAPGLLLLLAFISSCVEDMPVTDTVLSCPRKPSHCCVGSAGTSCAASGRQEGSPRDALGIPGCLCSIRQWGHFPQRGQVASRLFFPGWICRYQEPLLLISVVAKPPDPNTTHGLPAWTHPTSGHPEQTCVTSPASA